MAQEHAQKNTQKETDSVENAPVISVPQGDVASQAQVGITDDLLDEIDGVLEENAQEFVEQFVQKGGE